MRRHRHGPFPGGKLSVAPTAASAHAPPVKSPLLLAGLAAFLSLPVPGYGETYAERVAAAKKD